MAVVLLDHRQRVARLADGRFDANEDECARLANFLVANRAADPLPIGTFSLRSRLPARQSHRDAFRIEGRTAYHGARVADAGNIKRE